MQQWAFEEAGNWQPSLNSRGNVLLMELFGNNPIEFTGYDATADKYLDYVLTVNGVKNPSETYLRDTTASGDFDVIAAGDITSSKNLWLRYQQYSLKFEMALFNKPGSSDTNGFNRAYGVLNAAWVGFKPQKTSLYILNEKGKHVDGKATFLTVVSGLQSGDNYIATGKTIAEAKNNAVTIASVTVELSQAVANWVQFGKGNVNNTLV